MIVRENKIHLALKEAYIESFKNSEPSADFNKLVDEATYNHHGEKEIDFYSYECEQEVVLEILKRLGIKHKLTKKEKEILSINFHLGCSPKIKKNS